MLEFIQRLLQAYQRILGLNSHDAKLAKLYPTRIDQLILAEALLRKHELVLRDPSLPLQVAVVGPTQVGKSSIVNLLLTSKNADVSPLAGYTIHAQGFCHAVTPGQLASLQQYFGRFQQLNKQQLSRERYDCYALVETATSSPHLPPCVLWDTPDFDSIDAADYKEGVLRTLALADMIILVLSKEKYADQSVWELMHTIAPLKQPILICINKLAAGTEELIIRSLQEKWQQARTDAFPPIVPLLYQKVSSELVWPAAQNASVLSLAEQAKRRNEAASPHQYLQHYWQQWLEPIYTEHAALQEWASLCQAQIKQGQAHYQRDYLNHPQHYATFQVALVELLTLLEIPGLARMLSTTRKALLWPMKKLMGLGRKHNALSESGQEVALLMQIAEHLLIQLAEQILEKSTQGELANHWKELASVLRSQSPAILEQFQQQATAYHENFKVQITNTAQNLHLKLQEFPLLLNSLRTARASADAAAIGFIISTGGIGVHDLLLAPAMLAVTSQLTESALGSYMGRLEAQLKQDQLATVAQLLEQSLQAQLLTLPQQTSGQQSFQITPSQLQLVEQAFQDKRYGLRFF